MSSQLTYQQLYFPTTFLPPSADYPYCATWLSRTHPWLSRTHIWQAVDMWVHRGQTHSHINSFRLQRHFCRHLLTTHIVLHDFHELTYDSRTHPWLPQTHISTDSKALTISQSSSADFSYFDKWLSRTHTCFPRTHIWTDLGSNDISAAGAVALALTLRYCT